MSYTLAETAAACGLNKNPVLGAVKSGRISGTGDDVGVCHVEAAWLNRVFPPVASPAASTGAVPRHAPPDGTYALWVLCAGRRRPSESIGAAPVRYFRPLGRLIAGAVELSQLAHSVRQVLTAYMFALGPPPHPWRRHGTGPA
jgi:hypothetical protein